VLISRFPLFFSSCREQGEKLARKRQTLRKAQQAEVMAGRTSIFSLFDWQKKPYSSAYGRDSHGTYYQQ
jgi:uncharacterized protein YpmB